MEQEKNLLTEWLETYFDEVEPMEFYRDIFPAGELEKKGVSERGKYNAICVGVSLTEQRQVQKKRRQPDGTWKKEVIYKDGEPKMESKIYRFTVNDDLSVIEELQERKDLFCLMSPLSYAGKERSAENGRFMYAMAFDVDHVRVVDGKPNGLINMLNGHVDAGRLPKPTYIVSSGTGLHLYYVFRQPIPLFPNIVKQLQALKRELTKMIWNESIVEIKSEGDIQFEGIWQGFRMVGTTTKKGGVTRAFQIDREKVTLEYLNGFVEEKYRVTEFVYKSKCTRAQAKEKYPEWYERCIVEGKKGIRKPWAIKRDLYDWWKREILKKASVGHRYYCLMMLAIYAKKCSFYDAEKNPNPVTYEELEKDAFEIMEYFERLTVADDNHFDEGDVLSALEAFEDGLLTYPRNSVEYRAGFLLPKNKRNYQKQKDHLEEARAIRDIRMRRQGKGWREGNGRPKGSGTAKGRIVKYLVRHPAASKAEVIRETGISKPTVYKYYEEAREAAAQISSTSASSSP